MSRERFISELDNFSDNYSDDYNDVNDFDDDFDGDDFDDDFDGDDFDDDFVGQVSRPSLKQNQFGAEAHQFAFKLTNKTGIDQTIAITTGGLSTRRLVNVLDDAGTFKAALIGGGFKVVAAKDLFLANDNPAEIKKISPEVTAVLADGLIFAKTGTSDKTLEAVSRTGGSIEHFLDFIQKNPAIVQSITIDANDKAIFGGNIVLKTCSPFRRTGEQIIQMSDFLDPKQLNDKKIIVTPEKVGKTIQLDDQTLIIINLPGSINGTDFAEITLQWNFRSIVNNADSVFKREFQRVKAVLSPKRRLARRAARRPNQKRK